MRSLLKKVYGRLARFLPVLVLAISVFVSCKDLYYYDNYEPSWLGSNIYDYLEADGNFKYTLNLINDLDYSEEMKLTGSVTLFVAKDSAYEEFFKNNEWNVRGYEGLSIAQKKLLFNFSIINNAYLMETVENYLLYLRYAEAVNRLGKPNLAMAVLKNGLNRITMNSRRIIPLSEIPYPLPNYMNFTDLRFDYNIGIRKHGLGNVNTDTTYFIIPASVDTISYVEDLIVNELALETAFEGNRFHDLMRVAIRRNNNAFLAKKVAAKHKANKEAIENKLMTRKNWYLKKI